MSDEPKPIRSVTNSFEGLAGALNPNNPYNGQFGGYGNGYGLTLDRSQTLGDNLAFDLVTLNQTILNYAYTKLGLVQTVIGQPVDDAYRGGVEVETEELDEDEIGQLQKIFRRSGALEAIKSARKWARLFGGGGVLIVTDQDPATPLDIEAITEDTPLTFVAANRWELTMGWSSGSGGISGAFGIPDIQTDAQGGYPTEEIPYAYYSRPVHVSRVIRVCGQEAPNLVRQRLQGWGLSELERCLPSINSFLKFRNVIFELMDESKVDVYSVNGLAELLATPGGTEAVQYRVQLTNIIKNYKNAILMDKEDLYEQKQIAFSGLADLYDELRKNLSADLRIPLPKLFGEATEGFGSGEDALENYNALCDAEVREKDQHIIVQVMDLLCQQQFGFQPDLEVAFKPMRVMSALDEEDIADRKQNRVLALFDRDLLDGQETMESLAKDDLINVDSDVLKGTREPDALKGTGMGQGEFPEGDKPVKQKTTGGSKENSKAVTKRDVTMLRKQIASDMRHESRRAA